MKRLVAGCIALTLALCSHTLVAQEQGQGQGRGGRAGGAPAEDAFPTVEQFANSKEAQAHVAAATKIGGCRHGGHREVVLHQHRPAARCARSSGAGIPRLPTVQEGPIKLFDNLTYIGFNDVGAWVVPTSAGIILFDTLNSTDDAMKVIEPEMQKAGFDPAQIKYILLGHGTRIISAALRTCR